MNRNCLIDLHLHLDGSLSIKSARELAEIEGITLPKEDKVLMSRLMCPLDCKDLNEYLTRFELPCSLMQSKGSIEKSVYNLCNELKAKGFIYAEIRFAPQKHCEKGLSQKEVVKATIKGLEESGFNAGLILCCMRDKGNDRENIETVRLTKKYLGKGVCACDLAGAEALYSNEKFAYIFEEARRLDLPFTIHSGEAMGAESVKLAIEYGAKRIGHGVRAIEDNYVVRLLAERNIPIEVCPTSNINTCVFDNISDMPIIKLRNAGVKVTINSDNMSVSNTDVKRELELVANAFDLGEEDIKEFLLNSVEAAFVDENEKNKLKAVINAEFSEN